MINVRHEKLTDEDIVFMLENKPRQLASLNKYIHEIINYRVWEKGKYYLVETCYGTFASGKGTILEKIPKSKYIYEDIYEEIKNSACSCKGYMEHSNEHYFNYVWNGKKYDYVI